MDLTLLQCDPHDAMNIKAPSEHLSNEIKSGVSRARTYFMHGVESETPGKVTISNPLSIFKVRLEARI